MNNQQLLNASQEEEKEKERFMKENITKIEQLLPDISNLPGGAELVKGFISDC